MGMTVDGAKAPPETAAVVDTRKIETLLRWNLLQWEEHEAKKENAEQASTGHLRLPDPLALSQICSTHVPEGIPQARRLNPGAGLAGPLEAVIDTEKILRWHWAEDR